MTSRWSASPVPRWRRRTAPSPQQLPDQLKALTEQERKILGYVADGLTTRQIAAEMFLAEKTVRNYVSSLLAKLGLVRRTQAAILAVKLRDEHPR